MSKFDLNEKVLINDLDNKIGIVVCKKINSEIIVYNVVYLNPNGYKSNWLHAYCGMNINEVCVYENRLTKIEPCIVDDKKVCECGMEKHGFANHSTWCPKA